MTILTRVLIFTASIALIGTVVAFGDDDEGEEHERRHRDRRTVASPKDPAYKTECGSCHMLYPTGLLPARSWAKMMGGLKDHFGENASLDASTAKHISEFLANNAADHTAMRRSQKIANSIAAGDAPLRISETNYFKRHHHEVGKKIWTRKGVGSPANCGACHPRAEEGVFSEDEIKIPR